MDSIYYKSAKNCVISVLRSSPCTFEELCQKCRGLYPTLIRDILKELKIYDTLVPIYTTNQNSLNLEVLDDYYSECQDTVTASLQNNPVLSSWYFS